MENPKKAELTRKAASVLLNQANWPSEDIAAVLPILQPGATTTTGASVAAVPQIGLDTIAGGDLFDREYPPRIPIVADLIFRGDCVVVAGRPKSGKSWLVFQLAEAVDRGALFLGKATTRARVLYLALEDGARRIHERMKTRNWRPQSTTFAFGCLPFDVGEGIAQVMNAGAGYDVVVIDTLVATLTGKTNESDNTQMAEIMNAIAGWAHDTAKTVVIVHHAGKGTSEDPFETIRGASSIRGAYDMGIVLQRKPKEADAILHVESRDLDAPDMTVKFDAARGWTYEGDGARYEGIQAGRRVVAALLELGDWQPVSAIAEHLGITEQAARAQLNKAAGIGAVKRQVDPDELGKKKKPRDLWSLADVSTPSHN